MVWAQRHLVGLLFTLAILILLGSALVGPDYRNVVYIAAYVVVIAAILVRAKRRPARARPEKRSSDPPDPS
ncbi:MAG TPA: hypothetical protein VHL09_04680 [Dehalococcoidia bacterium]|nr:hypothetical protein [Dehalococcoidia bacterium]